MENISEYKPGSDITLSWEAASGLPWDPFDSCAANTERELVCPKCSVVVIARSSAYVLNLAAFLSTFLAYSLPRTGKDRCGTKTFHLHLYQVRIRRHEREPCGFQVRVRFREGSQECQRRGPVRGCDLPSVSAIPFAIRDQH